MPTRRAYGWARAGEKADVALVPLSVTTASNQQAAPLTRREIEVLNLMAEGASNKTIARRLEISVHTVKFHVGSLLRRDSASSTSDGLLFSNQAFASGRDFAAWLGLTPRAHSSGGKERLGSISKRGNEQLRTLLILGATSIIKQGKRGLKLPDWVAGLFARKPFKVVAVALANKTARIIWALLTKGGVYQKLAPATAG